MAPTKEEPKQTLPVGHPQAGYTTADLSFQDGVGALPPEEQEWHDNRDDAQADEAEAVAENEDKVAKAEAKAAEEAEKKDENPQPKTTKKTETAST